MSEEQALVTIEPDPEPKSDKPFWLISFDPELTAQPSPESFNSVKQLLTRLASLLSFHSGNPDFVVRIVCGADQWHITKGSDKRLVAPDGQSYRIVSNSVPSSEIDPAGRLCDS